MFTDFGLLAVLAVGLGGGGLPAVAGGEAAAPGAAPDEPIARLHWLGKNRLAGESNATAFMAIWNLPESQKLEAQTLDKLALALAARLRPALTNQPSTPNLQPATNLFRPLLEDLVREESYLEMRQGGRQAEQTVLAIRLDAQRATRWEANLSAILDGLGGARSAPARGGAHQWQWPGTSDTARTGRCASLARAGDWTILSLTPALDPQPSLLDQLIAHIKDGQAPFPAPATNYWMEADADLARLAPALGWRWRPETGLPKVALTAIGDGAWVRSSALLTFPKALPLALEPWRVPTNLVTSAVSSFTALRGFAPWLASLEAWKQLQAGPPPSQLFCWAYAGFPMAGTFAALQPEASNQVARLTDLVLEHSAPWSPSNRFAVFRKSKQTGGLEWGGIPIISPFLKSVACKQGNYVFGGLFPSGGTNCPLPAGMLQELLTRTNLVYYDWESTVFRVREWLYLGQAVRLIARYAQISDEAASLKWVGAASGSLGASGTEAVLTRPEQLSVKRASTIGLTGIELHLLAEWLESPQFPRGLRLLLEPRAELPGPQSNSPASSPISPARRP
jgi:hypothetical protein